MEEFFSIFIGLAIIINVFLFIILLIALSV